MKVRVGDLRQRVKEIPKTTTLPLELADKDGNKIDREVKIKQYLNIEEKLELLYLAYSVSINDYKDIFSNQDSKETETYLSGIYGINYYKFHITYTVYLIKYYTNISLPENVVDAYNLIKQLNLDELLLSEIPQKELDELSDIKDKFIETRLKEIDSQMSMSTIVASFFEEILKKLPNKQIVEKYMNALNENK